MVQLQSFCPTGAECCLVLGESQVSITGDGMRDLMALLVMLSQKQHIEKLKFSENLECHVLEVSDKGRWHRWPPE